MGLSTGSDLGGHSFIPDHGSERPRMQEMHMGRTESCWGKRHEAA